MASDGLIRTITNLDDNCNEFSGGKHQNDLCKLHIDSNVNIFFN